MLPDLLPLLSILLLLLPLILGDGANKAAGRTDILRAAASASAATAARAVAREDEDEDRAADGEEATDDGGDEADGGGDAAAKARGANIE